MHTTKFIDDGAVVENDTSHMMRVDDIVFRLNDNLVMEQTIIDFLRKPIVYATGVFSTTDTFPGITDAAMPAALFATAQGAMWKNKLMGYMGIRMDMNFKIVVNANRFQQGRYIMSFTPFGGAANNGIKPYLINRNVRLTTLVQRTTVPHVEIDLATDTSAELHVPYSNVKNYYSLTEAFSGVNATIFGYLNTYPYSPLVVASGSTTASYTIYASLTNVSLVGAASAQSGLPDREVTNKANGPISGPLGAVSRGFREFEQIPLLSSYASTISWVADRMSRTASMFGFSKPTQGDSLTKFTPLSAATHSTMDGDSDARSGALISKPGVVNLTGLGGSDYDEMDFSYIARKFAWFRTQNWTSTDVVGSLFSFDVIPYTYVSAGSTINWTPVGFVAAPFGYWRGSLKYKFKFVKTEFHSGRVSFSFFPTDNVATYTADDQYVNRWIVDIRNTNEVEIVIPYISSSMYQKNVDAIGVLKVSVVDPLIVPSTVSNTVTILCEIAGGDDFEVACPANTYAATSVVPQSGLPNAYNIMSGTIGSSSVVADPTVASSVSIGDKVSSFRAYLKRFYPIRSNTGVTANTLLANSPGLAVIVDHIPMTEYASTYYFEADMVATVASCYSIWRGGVRIRDVLSKGMFKTSSTSPMTCNISASEIDISSTPLLNSAAAASFSSINPGASRVVQELDKNGIVTVEVPQYSNWMGRAVADCMSIGSTTSRYGVGTDSTSTGNVVFFNAPIAATASVTPVVGYQLHNTYRSLADDGNFMGFVSVPPVIDTATNNVNWGQGMY